MARRDNRLYAQLTLDYLDSHKIAILSDSAIVAHIRMILWSRRLMTDGRIPEKMALHLAKRRPKILAELSSNDPDAPSLVKVGSDYILHDFSEHQTTRADIERQSQVNTENGKRGGRPKVNRSETDSVSESEPKRSQRQSTETTTSNEVVIVADRADAETLCDLLADLVEGNGSKRPTVTDKWRTEARLLLDKDGQELAATVRLLRWTQSDSFWKGNVLSMPTFRAKYDQLRLAANRQIVERKKSKEDQLVDVLEQGRMLHEQDTRKALE